MTPTQLQTLKTDCTVTRASVVFQTLTLSQLWANDQYQLLADFYNQVQTPSVLLWNPMLAKEKVVQAIVVAGAGGFASLTLGAQNAWFAVSVVSHFDLTLANVRQQFVDIFGAGSGTFTNLQLLARRAATYFEALLSVAGGAPGTGNVSDVYGQLLSASDVREAKRL